MFSCVNAVTSLGSCYEGNNADSLTFTKTQVTDIHYIILNTQKY